MIRRFRLAIGTLVVAAIGLALGFTGVATAQRPADGQAPKFQVDPWWPKPLPNNWLIGQAAGVAVDRHDHIWVIQRPRTLTEDERGATLSPPRSLCCVPAPPVLEFDVDGALLSSWGGPGAGYEWPLNEHGIFVDYQDNVWIGGNDAKDHQVLKFTRDGKFLLQIGRADQTGGDNDTQHLGRPANMNVDPATNELFIADGYKNHRVIVFDAQTGAYKRHWGANGRPPGDPSVKTPGTIPEQPRRLHPGRLGCRSIAVGLVIARGPCSSGWGGSPHGQADHQGHAEPEEHRGNAAQAAPGQEHDPPAEADPEASLG